MKKAKFDLEKALNGHPLVTRDGQVVEGFRKASMFNHQYPYEVKLCGNWAYNFTGSGKFYLSGMEHDLDLFLLEEDFSPKEGDRVEVKDMDYNTWEPRIFLHKDVFGHIICVHSLTSSYYERGGKYSVAIWDEMRPIKEPEIEITVRVNGEEAKLSDISEETLKRIRINEPKTKIN